MRTFEVIVEISSPNYPQPRYARLEFRGRSEWRARRIAEKHAREYKARHMRDAWVSEV